MKLVRALIAAAIAIGAAATIQMATSSPASASQPHVELCAHCWEIQQP